MSTGNRSIVCPDCEDHAQGTAEGPTPQAAKMDRPKFLATTAGTGAATLLATHRWPAQARAALHAPSSQTPETLVKVLYDSLRPGQRQLLCFDWDHVDKERGLLRTRVSNNWQITEPALESDFYSAEQQKLVREIFEGIVQPEWHAKFDKQLNDDAGGWGKEQSLAIFGKPGAGKFEFVLTGRHMTMRCDGNSAEHVAFGGPIFYGHAASGFDEPADHPGNVFWPQAVAANSVFEMLDEKQRNQALVADAPAEEEVAFRGSGASLPGLAVSDMSPDQREHVQAVLQKLIEPYRQSDRDEVIACLKSQGGLDKCHLAFFKTDDLGNDRVWDIWRLEGPAFVWHFRGAPHVHVWVNVADNPSVKLNAAG